MLRRVQREMKCLTVPRECRHVAARHGDKRAPPPQGIPRDVRSDACARKPSVDIDLMRGFVAGCTEPGVAVYDGSDVVDPAQPGGAAIAAFVKHLRGGLEMLRRDEKVEIDIGPMLAGLIEELRQRRTLQQERVDASRCKGTEELRSEGLQSCAGVAGTPPYASSKGLQTRLGARVRIPAGFRVDRLSAR